MSIQILPAKKEHFPILQDFLNPHEHFCTQLAFFVRKESEHIFVISSQNDIRSTDDLLGVFYCDKSLFHFIPSKEPLDNSDFQQSFLDFQKNNPIKCIIGENEISDFLCSILAIASLKPATTFVYDLMTLSEEPLPPGEPLSCDDYIKRCTEDDLDDLLDIQKKYIIKEVAPNGKQVSDLEASVSLRQILKNQLCLALLADEQVVAKANSNAIGWNYVQIGGVFTHPLFRRNNYAWHLVYNLCNRIIKTNKKVCLFVKERNFPAIQLYNRIGFSRVGKFQISYF